MTTNAQRELLVWQQRQIHPSLGIRYEQAAILRQKQIKRGHEQQLDALVAKIEALEVV